MIKRKAQLYEIEQSLPQKNSMYLKVIILFGFERPLMNATKTNRMFFFADYTGKRKRVDSESSGKSALQRWLRKVQDRSQQYRVICVLSQSSLQLSSFRIVFNVSSRVVSVDECLEKLS